MSTITRTDDGRYTMRSKELLVYLNMMKEDPTQAFIEIFHLGRVAGYQEAEAQR